MCSDIVCLLIKVKSLYLYKVHSRYEPKWCMAMTVSINRFQFLRGDFSGQRAPMRPPWSQPESRFTALCTRCHACEDACPEGVLVTGRGGFPEVNFQKGECTFCERCVQVCETPALQHADQPWRWRAEIGRSCLAMQAVVCRTCAEQCEVGAIRFRPVIGGGAVPMLSINNCTGCGACVAPCPAGAVQMRIPQTREEGVA